MSVAEDITYHEERITALRAQLVALDESPVSEYQTDNAGQRQGVKYRDRSHVEASIKYHRREISRLKCGNRALAIRRTG